MYLIEKNPNGMLDAMAACKLLWSGALSFDEGNAASNEQTTPAQAPIIHDGVISLYSVSREEVEAVLPDIDCLLKALDEDEQLSVDSSLVADAVCDALVAKRLSGATLFLLQSAGHPLIVEPVDKATVRVRYDRKLSRGIPNLQRLLCRMVCCLRLFNGEQGPLTILFAANDNRGNPCGIHDFVGCVEFATDPLDSCVKIANVAEEAPSFDLVRTSHGANDLVRTSQGARTVAPQHHSDLQTSSEETLRKEGSKNTELELLRVASSLESNAYATRELLNANANRIKSLEESLGRVEKAQPDAKAYKPASSMPSGLPTSSKASRSLVLWSAFYVAIGIALLLLGQKCITQNEELSRWLMGGINGAFSTAQDFASIMTGQTGQIGAQGKMAFPEESLAEPLRVTGFALMALGIVVPVVKILKRNRRLKREMDYHSAHVDYFAALAAKREMNAQITYAQDLESWSAKLKSLEEGIDLAKRARQELETAEDKTREALAHCYASLPSFPTGMQNLPAACTVFDYLGTGRCSSLTGPDGAVSQYKEDLAEGSVSANPKKATALQPTLRTTARSTDSLVKTVESQDSEERRFRLVVDHCNRVLSAT